MTHLFKSLELIMEVLLLDLEQSNRYGPKPQIFRSLYVRYVLKKPCSSVSDDVGVCVTPLGTDGARTPLTMAGLPTLTPSL
jgi:hypothetical protein